MSLAELQPVETSCVESTQGESTLCQVISSGGEGDQVVVSQFSANPDGSNVLYLNVPTSGDLSSPAVQHVFDPTSLGNVSARSLLYNTETVSKDTDGHVTVEKQLDEINTVRLEKENLPEAKGLHAPSGPGVTVAQNGQVAYLVMNNEGGTGSLQLPGGLQIMNLAPGQFTGLGQTPGVTAPMPLESADGEEPLYVNAKQYHRILKRREARAKLEALGKIPKERPKYLYESRHKHALNRKRGAGGIFTKKKPGQDKQDARIKEEKSTGSHSSDLQTSSASSYLRNLITNSIN
ncbi:nuclear transcription factor Y subunit A-7-like [Lingula anatina]|uniref:Nuclear transcription factor Y subunit n=1 Tax=Lingula anatina TaxID=7574 RepID=A0A1S3JBC9_LINAN|nr:nuclear transcription factor Y subunit A-7-like [Lingula anatina]|eukprot:XP_013407189.1 nuclear transcription factor Y subunit A-7-like [Lingula anatina]